VDVGDRDLIGPAPESSSCLNGIEIQTKRVRVPILDGFLKS